MTGTLILLALSMAMAGLVVAWRAQSIRAAAGARLDEMIGRHAEEGADPAQPERVIRVFPPRYRYAPLLAGGAVAGGLWLIVGMPIQVAVAAGVLLGVLARVVEEQVAESRSAVIEAQLAEAIDLLVGSLRAGASLLSAFDSALQESAPPLRPYLQEVAGRIRLGDDPRAAVGDLPVQVPLETFRLFATSLAIHWEVGGSLATTLTTVGRTVRDRIELGRRVRAQAVEANASVAVVLLLAYILGFLMWRTNPERLTQFVQTSLGTGMVAGVMVLQAVGIVWMTHLSKPDF